MFLLRPLPPNTPLINDNWETGDTCLTLVYLKSWIIRDTLFHKDRLNIEKPEQNVKIALSLKGTF